MKVFLVFLAVILLSGCRLTFDVAVDVAADGGGTLSVSVHADDVLEQSARQAGVDPLSRLSERARALDAWDIDEVVDPEGGGHTVELARDFEPGGFAAAYDELRVALDAPEARVLGPLAVEVAPDSGLISIEGALPLEVTEVAASDLGTDVASVTAQLEGVVTSTLTVTTPGPLVDGSVDGALVSVEEVPATPPYPDAPATLVWQTQPGTVTTVAATFEPGGSSLVTILAYAGGGALALALVAGGVWAQRRR